VFNYLIMKNLNKMKKHNIPLIPFLLFVSATLFGQQKEENTKIDLMLITGDYKQVIDTCRQILAVDSLNADIYYKMGLAYQNILSEDPALVCFIKAATIAPENKGYNFMVAKGYYSRGKLNKAKPLLSSLYSNDTLNWIYAYYLTSIYMQEGNYDESTKIYKRFYENDSTNYIYIDKLGFALLRKGEFEPAIGLFSRSLAINDKNINAIKNVAYLYTMTFRADTAIQILTRGIKIDPTDMDLYIRRATLYFSLNYTKRAMDDYLKILSSGDSSVVYIKRAGIGYSNNLQPRDAIKYLSLAHKKDTSDYETLTIMAQNFNKLKDPENAIKCYNKVLEILKPVTGRFGITYLMIAETQKQTGAYKEAIETYLKAQKYVNDPNLYMIIGNLYDEKLNNPAKAITYYQMFLDNLKNARMNFTPQYVESIRARLEYLKNPPPVKKQP